MTVDLLLEIALEIAYLTLFAISLVAFVRRPTRASGSVVAVFGCVALLYVASAAGRVWPELAGATGAVAFLALLALPRVTLRLVGHFGSVPRLIWRSVTVLFLGFAIVTVSIAIGVTLGEAASLGIILGALIYFVIGEAIAAILLWREGWRRAGASRARLMTAAVSTGLLSGTVLTLTVGGLATIGSESGTAIVGIVVRILALAAAFGYLIAFAPPRWLRGISQNATGNAFVRALHQLPSGVSPDRIWNLLASTARDATGAAAVAVMHGADEHRTIRVVSGDWPRDAVSAPILPECVVEHAGTDRATVVSIPMAIDDRAVGSLEILHGGAPLFVDDDIELLTVLSTQAIRAADREQMLVERERLIADLQAASAAKSDFLAAMSHELRTPLNAIIGFSELLVTPPEPGRRDGRDPETVTTYAEHIHDSGLHLLDLINEVLDLAKVEAGRIDLRPARFDLEALVAQTVDTMQPLADRKSVSLTFTRSGPLQIDADQSRVRQVVFNLLSNAIKFTPGGGSVTVDLAAAASEVRLTVADTGEGIAESDQARVFEAFQQAHVQTDGTQQGTGLGLALARQLVEAHRGRIELESTLGAGSRFTVILPLTSANATRRQQAPMPDPSDGPLVLIIEDEPSAAELLRVYLVDAGFQVAVAQDATSGLAAALDLRPTAIVLDIILPDIDGWEVLQRLKHEERTRGIPVVVVSVLDDAPLGLALGAVDYFVKPVARDALLGSLGRLTFTTKVRTREVTVLVIDDDPSAPTQYTSLLEPDGFTVVGCATGALGLEAARTQQPDLILLDLALPDIDGLDLVSRLKADPSTREIPIWVTTPGGLSPADKARLNGQVLGSVERDGSALEALRGWLERTAAAPVAART
jgi:signal transduction histidine kinase/DNA-binding response OmpR family regulator